MLRTIVTSVYSWPIAYFAALLSAALWTEYSAPILLIACMTLACAGAVLAGEVALRDYDLARAERRSENHLAELRRLMARDAAIDELQLAIVWLSWAELASLSPTALGKWRCAKTAKDRAAVCRIPPCTPGTGDDHDDVWPVLLPSVDVDPVLPRALRSKVEHARSQATRER
jgi:hypothetical protein